VAGFALSGLGNPPNLISLPTGAKPVFVATAQGKLFVAEYGLGKVAVIDPGTNSVATEVCSTDTDPCKVGSGPAALVATPDGTKLYCLNKDDGSVSVILPATNQLLRTITTGISTPIWGDVSADGTRVFVLNHAAPDNIAVIDTTSDATTDTVINSIPVGTESKYVIHQASQNRTYVASPGADSQCGNLLSPCLYVIENNTGIVTPVPMSGPPCNALDPIAVTALADGSRAYVADDKTNTVCVLNTTNNTFAKSIPVGTAPVFIASDPDSRRVLTANSGSGDVSIIDTISDTTVKKSDGTTPLTIPTGGTPTFIAITP
jgi:YVTN family beta-propeller protein